MACSSICNPNKNLTDCKLLSKAMSTFVFGLFAILTCIIWYDIFLLDNIFIILDINVRFYAY